MNILCVIQQNIFDVKYGGGQVARRNYDAIKEGLNKDDNLYLCLILPNLDKPQEEDKVLLLPGIRGDFQRAIEALQNCRCCRKKDEKYIWKFVKRINPDIIYLDTSNLGKYAKYIKQKYASKVIVFFHNVEADYSMNTVRNRGWKCLPAYWGSLKNEKIAVKYADKLISLTQRDKNRIKKLYGRCVDEIIPVSFKDTYIEGEVNIDRDKGLLFIGSLFPPNFEGIKWFVEEVMEKLPEQKLTIVGRDFETKKGELERDNVYVIGTVNNLEEYYYTYPIMVMPIRYGAGMKVKTAEAMMYAKVIIASDEALVGYEIPKSCGVYRCNTAAEYINTIKMIIEKGENYNNYKIRDVFLNNYDYVVTQRKFWKLIKAL